MAEQEFNATTTQSVIAQSIFAQSSAATGLDFSTEIIVSTVDCLIAEYQGTRAAIEAEGVIPMGTKWPEGFDDLFWEDDHLRYWLRRKRPEGTKGPRKQFFEVDWWMLRFDPLAGSLADRRLQMKSKELADTIYKLSDKGKKEHHKQWGLFWEATNDQKFQAFKALIPGVAEPKRTRKPKEAAVKSSNS